MKLLIFLTLILSTLNASATKKTVRVNSDFDRWTSEVSISFPNKNTNLKGLVILIPGSESIGEPAITETLKMNKGSVREISDLAKAINTKGFAYAYFNTRGVYPLPSCINEQREQNRLQALVKKCWNRRIRAKLDWTNIESDLEKIITTLKTKKEFKQKKLVLLSRSEGGMHISRLIRMQKINPDGLVNLGVPTVSPYKNSQLQLTLNTYLMRIETYMRNHQMALFNRDMLNDVFKDLLSSHQNALLEIIGRDGINQERLQQQIKSAILHFDLQVQHLSEIDRSSILSGSLFNQKIGVMGSKGWAIDALMDKVDYADSLKNYLGKRFNFYGEFDYQVGFNYQTACGEVFDISHCSLEIIPDVGHSLEEANGKLNKNTIEKIIIAISKAAE